MTPTMTRSIVRSSTESDLARAASQAKWKKSREDLQARNRSASQQLNPKDSKKTLRLVDEPGQNESSGSNTVGHSNVTHGRTLRTKPSSVSGPRDMYTRDMNRATPQFDITGGDDPFVTKSSLLYADPEVIMNPSPAVRVKAARAASASKREGRDVANTMSMGRSRWIALAAMHTNEKPTIWLIPRGSISTWEKVVEVLQAHLGLTKPPMAVRVPFGEDSTAMVLPEYWAMLFDDFLENNLNVVFYKGSLEHYDLYLGAM